MDSDNIKYFTRSPAEIMVNRQKSKQVKILYGLRESL